MKWQILLYYTSQITLPDTSRTFYTMSGLCTLTITNRYKQVRKKSFNPTIYICKSCLLYLFAYFIWDSQILYEFTQYNHVGVYILWLLTLVNFKFTSYSFLYGIYRYVIFMIICVGIHYSVCENMRDIKKYIKLYHLFLINNSFKIPYHRSMNIMLISM